MGLEEWRGVGVPYPTLYSSWDQEKATAWDTVKAYEVAYYVNEWKSSNDVLGVGHNTM